MPITTGMSDVRGTHEWEVRLRPHGPGRFLFAGFLAVWLCGWAAGETFAIWMLVRGIRGLTATGAATDWGPPVATGAFLLFWLTLWTLGGVFAIRELVRRLWSEDHLTVDGDQVTAVRVYGPVRIGRRFARAGIQDVVLLPRGETLALRAGGKTWELSQSGSAEERREAAAGLRRTLGLHSRSEAPTALPEGWEEFVTPEGQRVLGPSLARRRTQARVLAVAAALVGGVALLLAVNLAANLSLLPGAVILSAIAAGLGWGAAWLGRGRIEWRIGSGRIVRQKRFGATLRETLIADRLEMTTASDSDGDRWVHLDALGGAVMPGGSVGSPSPGTGRARIVSAMNDPATPQAIGRWLARETGVPLTDLTTPEARTKEIAALRAQLQFSGPLGRVLAGWIDRAVGPEKKRAS